MRVIIAGSRHITNYVDAEVAMADAHLLYGITPTCVLSGRALGPDRLGERWADAHGVPWVGHPAKWRSKGGEYNPRAGFQRNQEMAENADALVALWDGRSGGTKDMIARARRKGLLVHVHIVTSSTHP